MSAPIPDEGRLFRTLALLTFATGLVDAASVLGRGHVFTANMTGNVVFLGFSLAGAGRVATSDCVIALGAFLLGALVGGRLAAGGIAFRTALGLESVLLEAAAAVACARGDLAPQRIPEIALLAAGLGIQNASVRKLGVADMMTTVLTLTLTLTGLAADSSWAGGHNPRVGRRLLSVALMLMGALTGALLLLRGVRWALVGAALVALAACLIAPRAAYVPPATAPA